ncbi:hypothetical protein DNU06_17015 [Putridiphycobacter roseus]|uniref:Uncharacterized protein n=1 Tax=Putridiphycobacter roseus TaxID=2219161 RepID=A0A2W1MV09_9FLAO|nr:hypothetical protein [Putridiphycobacter roseus]PZE15647.1 hypothetical protein DNU06_17015 [Putridiphycobacter roseus]
MKNLLYIISFIGLISCGTEEIEAKLQMENVYHQSFPVILDTVQFGKYDFLKENRETIWLSTANYKFLYIGKQKDTIIVDHWPSFAPPPPPPLPQEYQDKSDLKLPKYVNPLAGYYIGWLEHRNFKPCTYSKIEIKLDTTIIINNAYAVLLTNNESDTISIGYGRYIPLIMEAQDSAGDWKPIEEQYNYMCGNGVGTVILPPNELVLTNAPIFRGAYKTMLRLTIGESHSREFKGSINYRQFTSMFTIDGDYNEEYKREMRKQ